MEPQDVSESKSLLYHVQKSLIGDDHAIPGPIGPRKITYCDHTASGRASQLIEDIIQTTVLPYYANTHTGTSYTGFSSHCFFDEARAIIRDSVRAIEKDDVVLFVPRGATAASQRLVHFLKVANQANSAENYDEKLPGTYLFPCSFPGCTRKFDSTSSLIIHARTHPDGEWSSWTGRIRSSKTSESVESDPKSPISDSPSSGSPGAIVIVGPYAHHSSFLPWKEAGATLIHVPPAAQGSPWQKQYGLDMLHLALALATARKSKPSLLLGIFTHGSNVNGSMISMPHITALLHAFGAFAIWDCAASAPHVRLNMNPHEKMNWDQIFERVDRSFWDSMSSSLHNQLVTCSPSEFFDLNMGTLTPAVSATAQNTTWNTCVDALYFSCHKFIGGGAGTPGVLVLKRFLMQSAVPYSPGGGTVFFVTAQGTPLYLGNDAEREEAGSPDVTSAVRAGLCFHLLRSIGWDTVMNREMTMFFLARSRLSKHPNIRIVGTGGLDNENLPILSIVVLARATSHTPSQRVEATTTNGHLSNNLEAPFVGQLHWNFVCAALNDFFGIQARGGCLCAGIYSHELLGISEEKSQALQKLLVENKEESLRPGFVRVSFSVTMSSYSFAYTLLAIEWIATYGYNLLKYYTLVPDTGEWRPQRVKLNALLEQAYRRNYEHDIAKLSTFQPMENIHLSANVAVSQANVIPKVSHPPRTVIRSVTFSRNGNIEKAQKGNYQPHPRMWLQSIKFDSLANSMKDVMDQTILVRFPEDANSSLTTFSEASLYSAYLAEAEMLLEEMSLPAGTSDNSFSSHIDIDNILSSEARALRWFALWPDFAKLSSAKEQSSLVSGSDCFVPWDITSTMIALAHTETLESPETSSGTSESKNPVLQDLLFALKWLINPIHCGSTDISIGHDETDGHDLQSKASVDSSPLGCTTPQKRVLDDVGNARNPSFQSASQTDFFCPLRPKKREKRAASTAINPKQSKEKEASATLSKDQAKEILEQFQLCPRKQGLITPVDECTLDDDGDDDENFTEDSLRLIRKAMHAMEARGPKRTASQLSPEEYRLRTRVLAPTSKALRSVIAAPGPSKQVLKAISRGMGNAIREFSMIQNGDRILVGLSGGKDSMTLLLELLRLQAIAPVWFEVAAATVDPMYEGYDPSPLREWCKSLNVPYFFESQPIMDQAAESMGKDSICSFCSRMKRGVLYSTCRREGYNVLALGQHLDDFAESFVMSAFRNGNLRTMKAHYLNDDKDIRIIRPLVYVRERYTREYAYNCKLPIIAENCPACFTGPTIRDKTKRLLAAEEAVNPSLFSSLQLTMKPLMLTKGRKAIALSTLGSPVTPEVLTAAPKNFEKASLSNHTTKVETNTE